MNEGQRLGVDQAPVRNNAFEASGVARGAGRERAYPWDNVQAQEVLSDNDQSDWMDSSEEE